MADVAELRRNLAAFAEHVGRPLSERQAYDLSDLRERTTCLLAARQTGKSYCLADLGVWSAFRSPGIRVLVISAGETAAKRLLDEMRRMVLSCADLAPDLVKEQTALLQFTNGSEIRSVPATDGQIRGWSVDLLLIDEAQLIPTEILTAAAFPTTAARPNARIVLAGTAGRSSGAFFNACKRGDDNDGDHRTIRWKVEDCPWIDPDFVEQMRSSMSAAQFAAEFEGQFWAGADSLFTKPILDRVVAPYVAGTLGSLAPPARLLGGVDWGATIDRSALCAIGRLPYVEHPAGLPVFGVALAHRWAPGYPLNDVVQEIAAVRAHWHVLSVETNGLGMPCAQDLARRILTRDTTDGGRVGRLRPRRRGAQDAFGRYRPAPEEPARFRTQLNAQHTTADLKAAVYSSLRMLIDRQQLVLSADDTDLYRELLFLKVSLNAGGSSRIEADESAEDGTGHDDLSDSLAFATGPHRREGHWSTVLSRRADPRLYPKQPEAPALLNDVPRVRTGGELLVPRDPIWQSIAGSETTTDLHHNTPGRRYGSLTINPEAPHA